MKMVRRGKKGIIERINLLFFTVFLISILWEGQAWAAVSVQASSKIIPITHGETINTNLANGKGTDMYSFVNSSSGNVRFQVTPTDVRRAFNINIYADADATQPLANATAVSAGQTTTIIYTIPASNSTIYIGVSQDQTYGSNPTPYAITCTFDNTPPTVTNSKLGGIFNTDQTITLTQNDANVGDIFYTTDGTDPASSGTRVKYTSPINIATPTNTVKSINLRYIGIDQLNNASSPYSEQYTIDKILPNINASPIGNGKYYNSAQTVTLTQIEDNPGTIFFTTDGTDPKVSGTRKAYTSAIPVAASTTLKFYTTDQAGNVSPVYTENYVIDTTLPTFSVNSTPTLTNGLIYVEVTPSENLQAVPVVNAVAADNPFSNYSLTFDHVANGIYYYTGNVSTPTLWNPPGSYNVTVTGTDLAGNVGNASTGTTSFIVDNTKPNLLVNIPTDNQIFSTAFINVKGVVTDTSTAASDITLYINNVQYSINSDSSFDINIPKTDGTYSLDIYAEDKAGNKSQTTSKVNVRVDTANPTNLSVSTPSSEQIFASRNIAIAGHSEDLTQQIIKLNGSPLTVVWTGNDFSGTYTVQADGKYDIVISSTDEVNHTSTASAVPVYVDTTPPDKPIISSPAAGSLLKEAVVLVAGSVNDLPKMVGYQGVTQVTISSDSATVNAEVYPDNTYKGYISLTEGNKTINVTAKDAAGNTSSAASVNVSVDTKGPSLTVIPNGSLFKKGDSVFFTVQSDEALIAKPQVNLEFADNTQVPVVMSQDTMANTWKGSYTMPSDAAKTGSVRVTASGNDQAGNPATALNSFTLDTTNPTLENISTIENELLTSRTVRVIATVNDNDLNEVLINNLTAATTPGTFTYDAVLGEGDQTITITARDNAGNSITEIRHVRIDTTNPTLSITSPSNGSTQASKTLTITGNASDYSGIDLDVAASNGGVVGAVTWAGNNFSVPVTFDADGSDKSVTFTAVDGVQRQTIKTVSFKIDTTKPTIVVSQPALGAKLNSNNTTVIFGVYDASSVNVTVNGIQTENDGNGTYQATIPLVDGARNDIKIVAVDVVGNREETGTIAYPYYVDVDRLPPTVNVTSLPTLASYGDIDITLTSNKTLSASPVVKVITSANPFGKEATLSSGIGNTYIYKYTVEAGDNGTATISVTAQDEYGNSAVLSPATPTFTIDLTAPELSNVSPLNDTFSKSSAVTVSGKATDLNAINYVDVSVDGGQAQKASIDPQGSFSAQLTNLTDGIHDLEVKAVDKAGNATVLTNKITVDTNNPVLNLNYPDEGQIITAKTLTIQGSVSDNTSAVSLRIDGQSVDITAEGSFAYLFENLTEGVHNVRLTAEDEAGNTVVRDLTFVVDTQAPTLTVSSPIDGSKWGQSGVTVAGSFNDIATSAITAVYVNGTKAATGGGTFSYNLIGLSDGSHTIEMIAEDGAGHQTKVTRLVEINNSIPTLSVSVSPSFINNGQVLITLRSDKELKTINATVKPNNSALSDTVALSYQSTVNGEFIYQGTWFALGNSLYDGTAIVNVSANDLYDNAASGTGTFVMDNTKPTVTNVMPDGSQVIHAGTFNVEVLAQDATSGIEKVTINGENAVLQNGKYTKEISYYESGDKTITVIAYDKAGNVSNTFTRTVTVDVGGPIFTIEAEPNKLNNTNAKTTLITVQANEALREAPVVTVTPVGGSAEAITLAVLDAENNIYQGSYTVKDTSHDGDAVISVRGYDLGGYAGSNTSLLTIDTNTPALQSVVPADNVWIKGTNTVNVSGTLIDISPVTVDINGTSANVSGNTFNAQLTITDGPAVITIKAVDELGNSTTLTRNIKVDNKVPQITVIEPTDGASFSNESIHVSGSVIDENSITSFKINNTNVARAEDGTFDTYVNMAEGEGQITLTAQDGAGYTNTKTVNVFVDKTAPTVTFVSPTEGKLVSNALQTVVVKAVDTYSDVASVLINGVVGVYDEAHDTWSAPITLHEGENTISVVASDSLNNSNSTAPANIKVALDTRKPVININAANYAGIATYTITVTADEILKTDPVAKIMHGSEETVLSAPQKNGLEYVFNYNVPEGNNGPAKIVINTEDLAGNMQTAEKSFIEDTILPAIILSTPDNDYSQLNSVIVAGQINENYEISSLKINDATVSCEANGSFSTTISNLQQGSNTITIEVFDAAGNKSVLVKQITYDGEKPTMNVAKPDQIYYNTSGIRVEGTASDLITSASIYVGEKGQALQQVSLVNGTFSTDLNLAEGTHVLEIAAKDEAGNETRVEKTVTVDLTMPALTVSSPKEGDIFGASSIVVTGTIVETNQPKVEITVNGKVYQAVIDSEKNTYSAPIELADGAYRLTVRAVDAAGNESSQEVNITVDTTRPNFKVTTSSQYTKYGEAITITVTSLNKDLSGLPIVKILTRAGNGVSLPVTMKAVNGSAREFTGSVSILSDLWDGLATVTVTGTDNLGHEGTNSNTQFFIDTQKPEAFITLPSTEFVNSTTVNVSGTYSDLSPSSGIKDIMVNGQPAQFANGSFSAEVELAEGKDRAITVNITDNAGNTNQTVGKVSVDATAPVVDWQKPVSNGMFNNSTLDVEGIITDSNVVTLTINGKPIPVGVTGAFNDSITLNDGTQEVVLIATDQAGNTATLKRNITVDAGKPVIILSSPLEGHYYNSQNINITGSTSDSTTPIAVYIDDQLYTSGTKSVSIGNTKTYPDGAHSVKVSAIDAAGNSSEETRTFVVDTIAPTIIITSPQNGETLGKTNYNVTAQVTDASPLTQVIIQDKPAVLLNGSYSASVTLVEGANTITVTAKDQAGNSKTENISVTVDTSYPSFTVSASPQQTTTGSVNITVTSTKALTAAPTAKVQPLGTLESNAEAVQMTQVPGENTWTGAYNVTASTPNGMAKLIVTGTDTNNPPHTSTERFDAFTIDTAEPVIVFSSLTEGAYVKPGTEIKGSVTDITTSVADTTYSIDGSAFKTLDLTTGAFALPANLAEGNHDIIIRANDTVNNQAEKKLNFIVDSTKPTLMIDAPQETTYNTGSITISGKVSDNYLPIPELRLNGSLLTTDAQGNFTKAVTLVDGPYNYSFEAKDRAGNILSVVKNFAVDTTAPIITAGVTPQITKVGEVLVNIHVNEELTQAPNVSIKLPDNSVDNLTVTGSGQDYIARYVVTNATPNGTAKITIAALDKVNNNASKDLDIVIDTVAPSFLANSITPGDRSFINRTDRTLIVKVTPYDGAVSSGIASVEISMDGGEFAAANSAGSYYQKAYTYASDGAHSYLVKVTDKAGNSVVSEQRTVTLDATKPEMTLFSPKNNDIYASKVIRINGTIADAISSINSISVDIAGQNFIIPVVGGAFDQDINVASDGTQTLSASANDEAGNSISLNVSNIKVDTKAPTVSVVQPSEGTFVDKNQVVVKVAANDSVSGITQVTIDGQIVTQIGGYYTRTLTLPDGPQTVNVIARDGAGHSTAREINFTVDTQLPQLSLTAPEEGKYYNNRKVSISGNVYDATSPAVKITVNGTQIFDGSGVFNGNYTYSSDGQKAVVITATDKANNLVTLTKNIYVDTIKPTFNVAVSPSLAKAGPVTITVTPSETLKAQPAVMVEGSSAEVAYDGEEAGSYKYTYQVAQNSGTKIANISVSGADLADNIGTAAKSFNVDTDKPKVLSSNPKDNDEDISIGTSVSVIFNEDMDASSVQSINNFKIIKEGLDTSVNGSISYNVTNKQAVFLPSQSLEKGVIYTVYLVNIKDKAGNILDPTSFKFTTLTSLEIIKVGTGTIPEQGIFAPTVRPLNFTINLTENAYVTTKILNGSTVLRTISSSDMLVAGDGVIAWDGKNDSGNYLPSGVYDYKITAKDGKGLNAVPITGKITLDNTKPTVQVAPAEDAANVRVDAAIRATFSEEVKDSINPGSFTLTLEGSEVAGTVSYWNGIAIFTPNKLIEGKAYTAKLSSAITDLQDNPLTEKVWHFTVGDFTAPEVTLTGPDSTALAKGIINLAATATDFVGVKSVKFEYSLDNGATWTTITNLTSPTSGNINNGNWLYDWDTASANINGNDIKLRAVASDGVHQQTSSFKNLNLDNKAPEITYTMLSPKYLSADGSKEVTVKYKLSEESYVTAQILDANNNGAIVTTLIDNKLQDSEDVQQLGWNGTDTNNKLAADGKYYIRIQAKDAVGNQSSSGDPVFSEIVIDTISPKSDQITIVQPAPGATAAALDAWPKVIFAEDIEPATLENGNFVLTTNPADSNAVVPGAVHYDARTRTAYYQANTIYDISTKYYVILQTGITDLAGNALDKELSWSFTTTPDKSAPKVESFTPYQPIAGDNTLKLHATDDTGIDSIDVDWSKDGNNWFDTTNLARESGTSVNGVWTVNWNTEGKQGLYIIRIKLADKWGRASETKYVVNILRGDTQNVSTAQENKSFLNNAVVMSIPENTFDQEVTLRANVLSPSDVQQPKATYLFVGDIYNFSVMDKNTGEILDNNFNRPITVTFKYNLENKDYLDQNSVKVYWYNTATSVWEEVESSINEQTQTISAVLTHFSQYSVMAKGKRVYLPTPKQVVKKGTGLINKFTADGVSNAPYEIYLPNEVEPWKYRIHTAYTKDTDACASCHRTHTAVGASLLQWYSVYDTCMACHDGTVTTTYNVVNGEIPGSPMPAFGGMFGNGAEASLSQHNVRGSVTISAAPGGSVVGITDPTTSEFMSWSVDFGCEDCHSPHGQGGNARILHPDPNGAARRNWLGGKYVNDDRIGQTKNLVQGQWTRVTPPDDTSGTVKYAVYPLRSSIINGETTMVRDTAQEPLTWIKGYPYNQYTKITDENYPDGIPSNLYTLDNSKGYTYLVFTSDKYLPKDDNMKISFVASLRVSMNVKNYLQKDENIKLVNGMNYFCSACHQDYNTSRAQFFTDDEKTTMFGEQEMSFTGSAEQESGDYSKAHRHQVGMIWKGNESVTTVYNGTNILIDKLRFEVDPWKRDTDEEGRPVQIVTCLTCHYAHGTSEELWQRSVGTLSLLPQNEWYKDEELHEISGSSALKRLPNMATCEECHEKAQGNEGYNTNARNTAAKPVAGVTDGLLSQSNARYVGLENGSCAQSSCHIAQSAGWTKTSHSKAMTQGQENINASAKIEWHSGPGLLEKSPDTNQFYKPEDVVYVLGYKSRQAYVVNDNGLKVLSKQWLVADKKWEDSSGADFITECVGCHSTGFSSATSNFADTGVTCEACHGPAENHVKYPSAKNIAMPAALSEAKQTDICGQCHIRGNDRSNSAYKFPLGFIPGQDTSLLSIFKPISHSDLSGSYISYHSNVDGQEYSSSIDNNNMYANNTSKGYHQEYIDFIQSEHYATEQISCSTCHSSHNVNDEGYQLKTSGVSICASCHDNIGNSDDWADYMDKFMPFNVKNVKQVGPPYDMRSHIFK